MQVKPTMCKASTKPGLNNLRLLYIFNYQYVSEHVHPDPCLFLFPADMDVEDDEA